VSQSPDQSTQAAPTDQLLSYRNAWSALSQLIGQGRSFSGYERNCCFLNTAGPRFANVSAATDLDLIDDGRAVVLVDWDFDGAIDLWLANRTAPRVRLLRNSNRAGHHWLSVRLEGTTCNRDAIGARIELYRHTGNPRRIIKTSHAGDGYLSQSSKWIHFGLGQDDQIQRLDVLWPGGQRETFTGLAADGRFLLVQGTGRAERWHAPPNRTPLAALPIHQPAVAASTRTWIMGRVPLPAERYRDGLGQSSTLEQFRGQPVLINLWSQSCLPCLEELNQWSAQLPSLQSECPHILALCVDGLSDAGADLDVERLLGDMPWSFDVGLASAELLEGLEVLQRTFLELQQPLQVPTSVLLDQWGRVASIYKGRVSLDQLRADRRLLDQSLTAQRDAAVPFPGRWASEVFPVDPFPVVWTLDLIGRPQATAEYLQKYVELFETDPSPPASAAHGETLLRCYRALAERQFELGQESDALQSLSVLRQRAPGHAELHSEITELLLKYGRSRIAILHAELAVRADPRNPRSLTNAGLAHFGSGQAQAAIPYFRNALEYATDDAAIHFHLANSLQMIGDSPAAVRHYRQSLKLRPGWPFAANNLAWILATHEDAALRDGAEAVRLAEQSCRATGFDDVTTLATLAAAYAEAGQFEQATATNRRAIDLLQPGGKPDDVRQLTHRQTLFESGRPYRESRAAKEPTRNGAE
jgi:tetratricopeptide (TPR) repeat protein